MKRSDLEALGLEKEAIEKIMGWNGADINAEKAKTTKAEGERDTLQGQLNTATETLKSFEGVDVAKLQESVATLTGQLEAQKKDFAFSTALADAIRARNGRSVKAISAELDLEALKNSQNQKADMDAALDALKESSGYLFGQDVPPGSGMKGSSGGEHGGGGDSVTYDKATLSGMTAAEINAHWEDISKSLSGENRKE